MDVESVAPPGKHPLDPYVKDIDAVGFALERVHTLLAWIDEHRASFEAVRVSDPEAAESELDNLADATAQARQYHGRLMELLRTGYPIDQAKRLPKGLTRRTNIQSPQSTRYPGDPQIALDPYGSPIASIDPPRPE